MDAQVLVPALVFVAILGAVWVGTAATSGRRTNVRRRLDDHAVQVTVEDAKRLNRINVLKQQTYSSVPVAQAVLAHLRPARTAAQELARAGSRMTVAQYLFIRLVAGGVAAAVVWLATGLIWLAPPVAVVALMLPRIVLRFLARQRLHAFEAHLAEAIDLIVNALRAGYGFLQALEAASRDLEGPIREELSRVVEEINVGANPAAALAAIGDRVDSYDFNLVATAVTVQRTVGGNLAEVLENIAKTIRERRRIRGEVRALTTGPRVSSYVLGLIPLVMLIFFSLTNSSYRDVMLHSSAGQLMIGFAAVWSSLGLFLSRKVAVAEY
jgi:tight adherence protein B